MATVERPTRVRNVAEASRRVLDPLQRLRGYIRLFVTVEAAAIVLLYVAACFWLSLVIDYGSFKNGLVVVDWVQWLPWWLRLCVTIVFVAGFCAIIARKAIVRLIQRFRDVALALELERRFPKILGDRLITAIELSNRRKVIEQGYSTAMVDETIVEAAERVEKLPLREVFRWKRLWFLGFLVFVATAVLYLVSAVGFCIVDSRQNKQDLLTSYDDYNEVLTIWFERNVLLQNTIWPRKSYLVFLEPADKNLRIGKDRQMPGLLVKALQYVIADSKTPEGWRQLTWTDLEGKRHLLGNSVTVAPPDWKGRDEAVGLTVDEVKLFFDKFNIRKSDAPVEVDGNTRYQFRDGKQLAFQWAIATASEEGWRPLAWKDLTVEYLNGATAPNLPKDTWPNPLEPDAGYTVDEVVKYMANPELKAKLDPALAMDIEHTLGQLKRLNNMRTTLDRIDDRVAERGVRRTMRKLIVPTLVTVTIEGPGTKNTIALQPTSNNEYGGQFGELKAKGKTANEASTFEYWARGEDYVTQSRHITVVPPPTLQNLYREDERPAYIYFRNGFDLQNADIKGRKQPIERLPVSLQGGDLVVIDCPAGTDLKLIGETDKDLSKVVANQPKDRVEPDPVIKVDGHNFTLTLPDVRVDRYYELDMIDADNVKAVRKIRIRVSHDEEPAVDLSPAQWLRKGKDGWIVTPKARIPFNGKIKDDHGLAKVNYVYSVAKIESTALLDVQALYASGAAGMAAGEGNAIHGLGFLLEAVHRYDKARDALAPNDKDVRYFPGPNQSIPLFAQELKNGPQEFITRARMDELLAKRQPQNFRTLFKEFMFTEDKMNEDLDADPFHSDFNMLAANLLATGDNPQLRYRVLLWVEATDTDLDSTKAIDGANGPKVGASKERYPFVVVSQEELVGMMGQDEEKLSGQMSLVVDKLQDIREKLKIIGDDLGSNDLKPANLSPMVARVEALGIALDSEQTSSAEVLLNYEAIFKELKGNDIRGGKITTVSRDIIKPLRDLDHFEYGKSRELMKTLQGRLDSKDSFELVKANAKKAQNNATKQVDELIDKVQAVLDKMQKQVELSAQIERLRKLNVDLQRQSEILKHLKDAYEKSVLEGK